MAAWEDRFEAKVDRSGTCHLWTGAKTAAGVGQVRIDGKLRTAAQLAWELERGPIPAGGRIRSCRHHRLCVRVVHLEMDITAVEVETPRRKRAERGNGSMREVGDGKWKLTVDAGIDNFGRRRRISRTIRGTRKEAARSLATLSAEVQSGEQRPVAQAKAGESFTVNDLVEWYIDFARNVRGLERTTVFGYQEVYQRWLQDQIGHRSAERLSPAQIDIAFGRMRREGLSHSRMNNARAALSGAYKWGRRHDKVNANPMRGFELPKSMKVPKRTTAPELEELHALLNAAGASDPDFSPVLTLAATTGMRRGELSGLRRDRLSLDRRELRVERSISEIAGEIEDKPTKTHDTRVVRLDDATVSFLRQHLKSMDARADSLGLEIAADGYVFSLEPGCKGPMRPELMTRRMRKLRKSLGADSRDFNATILAMRKWTSTELTDAGFNPSTVSGRQGHTVQVMLRNYSSRRASADQAAANHLGQAVHGKPHPKDS